jgi:hypothetical protein
MANEYPPKLRLPAEDRDDDPPYRAALEVERNAQLNAEMAEWEAVTLNDGLDAEVPTSQP